MATYRGYEIVNIAKSCIGKRYGSRFNGYTMDCTGLVCYCLGKVLGIKKSTLGKGCRQQWEYFNSKNHQGTVLYKSSQRDVHGTGRNITASRVKAGDLLYKFNYDNSGNHHVVIATGTSYGTVDASGGSGVVREKSDYSWAFKDVDLWVRMFEDGATSTSEVTDPDLEEEVAGGSGVVGAVDEDGTVSSTISYDYSYLLAGGLPLTNVDVYNGAMNKILSQISKGSPVVVNGLSMDSKALGYLSDLTHGGQFRFILPEFSESLTANYEVVTIPGRSAGIQSYSDTAGRSKTISLDLMAGTGLYIGKDPVSALEKDIAFLNSLVYPDYSASIVNPPPIVLLYLGPSSILKGVVSTISVDSHKPYTTDGRPMYYTVNFTVTQASDDPPDYKDIRDRNSVSY